MEQKEFEIDLQDAQEGSSGSVQLPLNFLTFGEIENDDVKVYIKQSVYKALEKLAASDTSKELGSILLGQYCQELGKTHVIISEYVEAKYTDASASTLTFTHETWDYVYKEQARRYPDEKIIGWQHTHPNYGIFLSNYDMFIQENFFNMPFQVAYVIDPVQNIRGFFQWKDGKVEKLKGYYIYDDVGKPIKIEQTRRKTQEEKPAKPARWMTVLLLLLCLTTVILSLWAFSLARKYEEQMKQQEIILNEISNQNTVINDQANTITALQQQIAELVQAGDGKTTVADLIAMLESHELTLQNQEEVLEQLKSMTGGVRFVAHTVVAGESLSGICQQYGVDYLANRQIVLAINGITNPDVIHVGQVILVPVSE